MALFKRKSNQTISELEEYYSNRNNRTGKAWVMALVSLAVTVGILAGLFFGGRWVYRSIKTDNTIENVAVETETSEANNNTDQSTDSTQGTNTGNVEPEGVVSDEAASTTEPNTSRVENQTQNAIPDTGSGSLVAVLATSAGIIGYAMSRRYQIRKSF